MSISINLPAAAAGRFDNIGKSDYLPLTAHGRKTQRSLGLQDDSGGQHEAEVITWLAVSKVQVLETVGERSGFVATVWRTCVGDRYGEAKVAGRSAAPPGRSFCDSVRTQDRRRAANPGPERGHSPSAHGGGWVYRSRVGWAGA